MTLLITGGGGFVMSHLARTWLEADDKARVVVLDASELDEPARRFFAPVADRLDFIRADVLDNHALARIAESHDIRRIAHGATITSMAEDNDPRRLLEVNISGTANLLQ